MFLENNTDLELLNMCHRNYRILKINTFQSNPVSNAVFKTSWNFYFDRVFVGWVGLGVVC